MPEGHTIHRLAREHRAALGGLLVRADSPQGRFADGARMLDGRELRGVKAYGKHLLYDFDGVMLHVHLGLFGRFRTFRGAAPEPSDGTRLRLAAGEVTVHLAGATTCELVDPEGIASILDRLGPDPLGRRPDPERAWRALQRRTVPIGAALLDQKVLAGIGNVYRAEALFACGIDPQRSANEVTRAEFEALWAMIVAMLKAGLRRGRIVTVDPADVGARSLPGIPEGERTYVYGRGGLPCRRCGIVIRAWVLGGRTLSACPGCQHLMTVASRPPPPGL